MKAPTARIPVFLLGAVIVDTHVLHVQIKGPLQHFGG